MSARDLANFIRPLKDAAARPTRPAAAAPIDERMLRVLAVREHVERCVVAGLQVLAAHTPDLHIVALLRDGAWLWSLRGQVPAPNPRRRRPNAFCRLDFGLHLDTSTERLTVECRATVRDADLPKLHWESGFVATDWAAFDAWIEEAELAFAARYFGGRCAA